MTMDFGIALEIDLEVYSRSAIVNSISDALTAHFLNKSYGNDIERIDVGFICVRPVAGLEEFSKQRKPRYVSSKKIKMIDGSFKEIKNAYSYDIKLDATSFDSFAKASDSEASSMVIDLLIESLSNFDNLPKKVKDFDVELFKKEVTNFLRDLSDRQPD